MNSKKIGIFGGSFNPIHFGHLKTAEFVLKSLKLNKVIFVPVYKPCHRDNILLDYSQRVELIKCALNEFDEKKMEVCELEKDLGEVSYTVDTLKEMLKLYPKATFYEIIGEDSYNYFTTWKEYKTICELSYLVVLSREGKELEKLHENVIFINNPLVDISATDIRKKIKNRESIVGLIPNSCIEYIKDNCIWRD